MQKDSQNRSVEEQKFKDPKTVYLDLSFVTNDTQNTNIPKLKPKATNKHPKIFNLLIFGDKKAGKKSFIRNFIKKKILLQNKSHHTDVVRKRITMPTTGE